MPKKEKSPTFITEYPLKITPQQAGILEKRFEAARQVYNAALGESLRRLDLMRQSKAWQKARSINNTLRATGVRSKSDKALKKEASELFKKARNDAGFSSYLPMDNEKTGVKNFRTTFSGTWIHDHLDTRIIGSTVLRAFRAVERYCYRPPKNSKKKNKGRPYFKRFGAMESVEGETNKSPLRFDAEGCVIRWKTKDGDLRMPLVIDEDNPVKIHGLAHRVKFVRIARRVIRGKVYFYAQLVQEGKPLQRTPVGDGVVGLDLGPSTIAAVGEDEAFLQMFCAELDDTSKETRKLQRKVDRQRRANNPDKYEPDFWKVEKGRRIKKQGKVKKGVRGWVISNQQRKTEAKLKEIQRQQAAYRKSLHGRLVNRIIEMGNTINLEKLSYVAFQKMFGKSVGKRAPGAFVAKLRQKAEAGVIDLSEFSTYSTKFSQLCHNCGKTVKKPLSQRWHKCECGITAQRDLYSAFLAACWEDGGFNATIANERWSGVGKLLEAALNDLQNCDTLVSVPASFGLSRSQSDSSRRGMTVGKAVDAVPEPDHRQNGRATESRQDDPQNPTKIEQLPLF